MASSSSADKPIEIEPLTKEEQEKHPPADTSVKDNPNYPEEWKNKPIGEWVDKGYRYYKRDVKGKPYMLLRKGSKDHSIGLLTEEKEAKLFAFHPNLEPYGGVGRPEPWTPRAGGYVTPQGRGYLSVPIARIAVIPRDFVPSINVIRYFQIMKENGFPGDFSAFINDIVTTHFRKCFGIKLPVMVETEEEEKEQVQEEEEIDEEDEENANPKKVKKMSKQKKEKKDVKSISD